MIKIIQDSAKVLILSLVVLFSVHLAGAVWSEPTVAPTGGNISAPLDVSSTGQTKAGGLILNTGGSTNGLVVSAGKVGIGVADPASALEVYGGSGASSQSTGDIFRLSSSGLARLLFGFDPITPFGSWIQSNSSYPILLNPVAGRVGIGTTSPSQALSVAGTIYSSTGGFKFPDGTTQITAAGGAALEAFGGLYTKRDTVCTNTNPLTSACSCAAGFTDTTFLTFSVNASFSCGWYEGYTTTGPCGQSSIETHECWNPDILGSASWSSAGTYSFVVPVGITSLTIDLRAPGGGGGGGSGSSQSSGGSDGYGGGGGSNALGATLPSFGAAGTASVLKRGVTVIAEAGVGTGGAGGAVIYTPPPAPSAYYVGGAAGSNSYSGLTLSLNSGSAGGAAGSSPHHGGYGSNGYPGNAGSKITGSIAVTPGETLTVIIGVGGKGGAGGEDESTAGNPGSNGTDGTATISW